MAFSAWLALSLIVISAGVIGLRRYNLNKDGLDGFERDAAYDDRYDPLNF